MDGDFTITIHGTGTFHNKHGGTDANRMAGEFVNQLRLAGHTVLLAEFETDEQADDVAETDYIAHRDTIESARVEGEDTVIDVEPPPPPPIVPAVEPEPEPQTPVE